MVEDDVEVEVDRDYVEEQVDQEIVALVQHQKEQLEAEELAFFVFEFVNEGAGSEDYLGELDSDAQLFFVLLQDVKVEQR